jgi:hypothetical protein
MSERGEVYDRNRELARRINDDLLRDPNSPYAGKWIGIADGQVVVVGDALDDVHKRLHEIEPDPSRDLAALRGAVCRIGSTRNP